MLHFATRWPNILILGRLLFTLPASNVDRIVSTLKLLKGDRRSRMGNDTLEEALNADYIPLKDFNPDDSIQKW